MSFYDKWVTEYNNILKFSLDTRPLTRLILTITFIYTTTTGMPSLIQMLCIMLHSPALQCTENNWHEEGDCHGQKTHCGDPVTETASQEELCGGGYTQWQRKINKPTQEHVFNNWLKNNAPISV